MIKERGRKKVIIENVQPEINCGRHPVKRVIGEGVTVTADIFVDGHDQVDASVMYRSIGEDAGGSDWEEVPMKPLGNDRWKGTFRANSTGTYVYTIHGFIDYYGTWLKGVKKKQVAGQDISVELLTGAGILEEAKERISGDKADILQELADEFRNHPRTDEVISKAHRKEVLDIVRQARDEQFSSTYSKELPLWVERKKALFSTWYEVFPRSAAQDAGRHGTFADMEKLLPGISTMGFDVLYLPPIHPIGQAHRKGKNNTLNTTPGDPGSPWAIGGSEGGHKAIHPQLGTLEEFRHLVHQAQEYGIEVALDFAIQCSPDHPWVKDHPDWFRWRPDGTIQYAENPPKKYQDVLPINFETEDWQNLWAELKGTVEYWIAQGVKIFRVDNPHTKPFPFWEWLIREIRNDHPDIIFLAEAFTRPRIMEKLGKVGFTQSYTYFTWRDTAEEFHEYLTELTRTERRDYFRPNFWPNTPDILPRSLQYKPTASFIIRLILAATMSSNYGLYGPVYELGLNIPHPDREEYIDSEKYEIKHWNWTDTTPVSHMITLVNRIRRQNPALQTTWHIEFCECNNDQLLAYARKDEKGKNRMIIVVNLDPYHAQQGWVKVPLSFLDVREGDRLKVEDLLTGVFYRWTAGWNYVRLDPDELSAHMLKFDDILEVHS